MLTIGVELNHVVRNINKQILKYYAKEFDPSMDWEEMDDKCDVFEKYCKFNSKYEKNNFIYIDYPYEIFGISLCMEKNLARDINNWLAELANREDEEIRVIYYSLYEEALTIQSTFFFLSKIGTRVREIFFPKHIGEIWQHCDVAITANDDVLNNKPLNKQTIKIISNGNKNSSSKGDMEYNSMMEVIKDDEFIDKLIKNAKKEEIK
jgi:hypothetical protein